MHLITHICLNFVITNHPNYEKYLNVIENYVDHITPREDLLRAAYSNINISNALMSKNDRGIRLTELAVKYETTIVVKESRGFDSMWKNYTEKESLLINVYFIDLTTIVIKIFYNRDKSGKYTMNESIPIFACDLAGYVNSVFNAAILVAIAQLSQIAILRQNKLRGYLENTINEADNLTFQHNLLRVIDAEW